MRHRCYRRQQLASGCICFTMCKNIPAIFVTVLRIVEVIDSFLTFSLHIVFRLYDYPDKKFALVIDGSSLRHALEGDNRGIMPVKLHDNYYLVQPRSQALSSHLILSFIT